MTSVPHAAPELYRFLNQAVSRLRWATIAILMLLAVVTPTGGRTGIPNWVLILLFAGYNLLVELFPNRLHRQGSQGSAAQRFVFDLPVAALVYSLTDVPGAPLFVLIVLAVICSAVNLALAGSLLYTSVAMALAAIIEPTLPLWVTNSENARELVTRLIVLALAGTGTGILRRRLVVEREMARIARDQADRLEVREQLREDYISSISHGLRTPFTAVRAGVGMIETSMDKRMTPEERELLTSIQQNADRVNIRINDLLALNQLEAGALRLDRRPVDMRDLIADAIGIVHPLILEKSQTLEADLPEPLQTLGDTRRLEQVIVNVLDNAHQHTPTGTCITVSGKTTAGEILLTVSDDGPGVPTEEHEAIFQRFHSVDTTAGGWGLGLAVARAIVELHGGQIWVESLPGRGAAFYVRLPACKEGARE